MESRRPMALLGSATATCGGNTLALQEGQQRRYRRFRQPRPSMPARHVDTHIHHILNPPPRWPPPRPRVSPPAPQLGTPGGIFSPPDSAPPPRPVHEFVQWEPTTAGLPIIRTFAQMPVKAMGSITTTAGPVLHQYVSAPGYAPGSSGALVPLPSSAPPFVILAVIGSAVMCCAGFGVVVLSLVYRTGRAHGRRYDRAQTRDMEDEQG